MTKQDPARMAPDTPTRLSPAMGCGIAALVALLGIAAMWALASLLARGDWVLARGELTETRIWLVREASEQGFGFSSSSLTRESTSQACVQTEVRFFLWKTGGESGAASYCTCYERHEGEWQEVGDCGP